MTQDKMTSTIRRQQIIEAARKIIINDGSEHVTIKGIAKEVGISEAAIYRYFKQKRDILLLLVDDIGDSLLTDIEDVGSRARIPNRLDRILQKHISAIEQRHGISFQVIAEIISLGDKGLNSRVSNILSKYITELKSLLDDGVEKGEFCSDLDTESAAILLFSMIQGIVNLWYLSDYNFNLKRRYETMWKIFHKTIVVDEDNSVIIPPTFGYPPR
jgi:TetR/AcrR family fatty acid metabolism transcriptional regulator